MSLKQEQMVALREAIALLDDAIVHIITEVEAPLSSDLVPRLMATRSQLKVRLMSLENSSSLPSSEPGDIPF